MRCGLARCPGAKSTSFSAIPVVSFSHFHAISSRLQCNSVDLPSGRWVPTLPTQYAGYRRKQSTWHWNSKDSCLLFFYWEWCWLPMHWLPLGFWIIRKYPSFITSNYRIQKIWFILSALQKVQTQFLATFFLFIWRQFLNHFCTNYSHVQFFPKNSSNVFHVQSDSLSYCSNNQPSVF